MPELDRTTRADALGHVHAHLMPNGGTGYTPTSRSCCGASCSPRCRSERGSRRGLTSPPHTLSDRPHRASLVFVRASRSASPRARTIPRPHIRPGELGNHHGEHPHHLFTTRAEFVRVPEHQITKAGPRSISEITANSPNHFGVGHIAYVRSGPSQCSGDLRSRLSLARSGGTDRPTAGSPIPRVLSRVRQWRVRQLGERLGKTGDRLASTKKGGLCLLSAT